MCCRLGLKFTWINARCRDRVLLAIPMAWMLTQYHLPGMRSGAVGLMPSVMPATSLHIPYWHSDSQASTIIIQSVFNVLLVSIGFNVRSLPGAIIMMSLVLYPYILC